MKVLRELVGVLDRATAMGTEVVEVVAKLLELREVLELEFRPADTETELIGLDVLLELI